MNIDWSLLSKQLPEISGDYDFSFVKYHDDSSKIYSDKKVKNKHMESGLKIIKDIIKNDNLKQNIAVKKQIKKELYGDKKSIVKIHEFNVKTEHIVEDYVPASFSSHNKYYYIKAIFETCDNSIDMFVYFELNNKFVLIGVNQAHPYIYTDEWSYNNSDGSGPDIYIEDDDVKFSFYEIYLLEKIYYLYICYDLNLI